MKPFFSIILPTYNRGYILENSIKSIIRQEFSNWELIVIDDGSTDDTSEVIKKYLELDKRINYYYQRNSERSAARNNGIAKAEGDFITFLDSDDQFEEKHLKNLFDSINKSIEKSVVFVTGSQIVDTNGKLLSVSQIKPKNCDSETILENTITPGQMCIPSNFLRKHLFNEKIRISEDTELLFRLIEDAPLKILDYTSLLYIHHVGNSINPFKNNVYLERKKTLELIFKLSVGKKVSSRIKRKVLSDCFFGISKYYAANSNNWMVRWSMIKAIIQYPEQRFKEKFYLVLFPKKSI
jgi:glycosyltransferase involved in cell wall biosynthesis